MKKFIVTLALATFIFSISANAWAANSAQGSSCTGNPSTSNVGDILAQAGSGCSGAELDQMFKTLNPFGCTNDTGSAQSGNTTNGTNTQSGCTSQGNLYEYCYSPSQQGNSNGNSGCPTSQVTTAPSAVPSPTPTSAPSAAPKQVTANGSEAVKAAAAPKAEVKPAATEAPQASTPETCNDSGCTAGNVCGETDCADSGILCNTSGCTTGTPCGGTAVAGTAAGSNVYDFVADFLQKCGIDPAAIRLPGCTSSPVVTAPPADPAPTPGDSGTGTTAPPDSGSGSSVPDSSTDNLSFEHQVVALVNEQRAANGLSPLTLNESLSGAARAKSQDMHDNNYFSHTSPTYGSPFDMLKTFGFSYKAAGENIAMGYASPEAVMSGWMNSSGHRANILSSSYTQIGVGYVADGNYWTQEFIG